MRFNNNKRLIPIRSASLFGNSRFPFPIPLFFVALFTLFTFPLSGADLEMSGEMAANYRGIGGRPTEVEIENQLYLSDFYFSFTKLIEDRLPFFLEFKSNLQGEPVLNQFHINYGRIGRMRLTFGKFIVPFGLFNELYRPGDYLAVTRPLPYASPGSLDYVARLNFAHPIMAAGYSDLGLMGSWRPKMEQQGWSPSEVVVYVTNGLQENPLLGRALPRSELLGVAHQQRGVLPDYGHENLALADNNDSKQVGARVRFSLGELRVPGLPEGRPLQGVQWGVSAMGSKFDVEDLLDYGMAGTDFVFQLGRYSIAMEALYAFNDYRIAKSTSEVNSRPLSEDLPVHREHLRGYYVSNSWRLPRWFYGTETFGFLGLSAMLREGGEIQFDPRVNTAYQAIEAMSIRKWIYKYTGGVRSRLKEYLDFKVEYSYWDVAEGFEAVDIYQWSVSSVVRF